MGEIDTAPVAAVAMSPYQLQPRRPFSVDKVRKASREVLEEFLDGVEYDSGACSALAGTIAATLRDRVKALNFDRQDTSS